LIWALAKNVTLATSCGRLLPVMFTFIVEGQKAEATPAPAGCLRSEP
jgi:hypothetical protein